MSGLKVINQNVWVTVYLISVAVFLMLVGQFYQPEYGFTSLIEFGDRFSVKNLPPHCYVMPKSDGYDGQFYAKLALDPLLLKPAFDAQDVDGLAYREAHPFELDGMAHRHGQAGVDRPGVRLAKRGLLATRWHVICCVGSRLWTSIIMCGGRAFFSPAD